MYVNADINYGHAARGVYMRVFFGGFIPAFPARLARRPAWKFPSLPRAPCTCSRAILSAFHAVRVGDVMTAGFLPPLLKGKRPTGFVFCSFVIPV